MDQSSAPTFSIIIKTIPADADERSEFLEAFSSEFHLSQELSQEVLECVPVAIFSELNRGEVSDVKPSLKSLSEAFDTQFFITSSPVSALPTLTWPEHPDFDDIESDRVFSDVELTRQNDSVVCPECEHILVLDQSGDRVTAEKLANITASDTTGEQEEQPEKDAMEEDLEDLSEELDEDLDDELEEDIEEELEELLDDEEHSESESDSSSSSSSEERGKSETQVEETATVESDTAETATRPTEGASNNGSQSSNDSANVFLSGMPDADMEDILDLLTEVRDCSASEAERLMDRPITPIKNGVPEDEAKELKERFNEIGVTVNIVHK